VTNTRAKAAGGFGPPGDHHIGIATPDDLIGVPNSVRAGCASPTRRLIWSFGVVAEKNFAVFLEDVVLVTAGGYEVLSQGLPYTVEEVEALMRQKSIIEASDHR
jgi:hypothetical protein